MRKLNIMVVTTGRADYGLLYPLVKKIYEDKLFNLQLIATGSHLSPLHGKTIELIEKDGFEVHGRVEMTGKNDSEASVCLSISKGMAGFSAIFNNSRPDLLLVLGDRYELWSVCIPAVIFKIPIAHIHGGEATFGLIDDPIRHSITKMSAFHFASIELYARRIVQMGEDPERVFVVGAIGLDNIMNIPMMQLEELSEYSGVDFGKKVALMTYHPVTLDEYQNAENQIIELLEAIIETDLFTVITIPNADTAGNIILKKILFYAEKYPEKILFIKNLGQKAYLSAMKYAGLMIGNSSSGIIESASFRLPVVNIGDRQAGRFKPRNVIDCPCLKEEIIRSINQAMSDEFAESISKLENPYGDGHTAGRILRIIKSIDFENQMKCIKKGFYDLNLGPIHDFWRAECG